ncbi:molybdopterin molybdenumtransferase [Colletotrichum spaethianum]|uniref:molybdopterin adenylyltransferase n=1 Tax=Colletotrichum spaethianum TaxID=700344 RepID=A0AA37P4L5_9PEZI|nr:molybdopterin molybdenumtransferase [Colletotrichum spaethianum]GKT41511.1 molybdopterin molybdenumtransferase [Colletotrichum spaethianum]
MTSYEAAVDILQKTATELQVLNERNGNKIWEEVYLVDAVGRVAAAEVVSPTATPTFDTSAMDGYAVCSEATMLASPEKPVLLKVFGTIAAGDEPTELDEGIFRGSAEPCLEIMTGGIFPKVTGTKKRFDACVRIEDTAVVSAANKTERAVMITKPVPTNANRRPAGCDIQLEERIIKKGDTISSSHIMPLASVGISKVQVFKKPRVAVWSTGKELVAGNASSIPDVNGPFLMAALREASAEPAFLGTLHDSEDSVREALQETIDGELFDMILTTGGVSVGKFDFVASSLSDLGATTHFHGVAMRPGHPVLFAQVPGRSRNLPVFGLPGNPGATAACFRFLVAPFLRSWQHQTPEIPIIVKSLTETSTAGLGRKVASPGIPPTTFFRHGTIRQSQDGNMVVELSKQQSPAKLGPFIGANCWVQLGGHSQGPHNIVHYAASFGASTETGSCGPSFISSTAFTHSSIVFTFVSHHSQPGGVSNINPSSSLAAAAGLACPRATRSDSRESAAGAQMASNGSQKPSLER